MLFGELLLMKVDPWTRRFLLQLPNNPFLAFNSALVVDSLSIYHRVGNCKGSKLAT